MDNPFVRAAVSALKRVLDRHLACGDGFDRKIEIGPLLSNVKDAVSFRNQLVGDFYGELSASSDAFDAVSVGTANERQQLRIEIDAAWEKALRFFRHHGDEYGARETLHAELKRHFENRLW